MALGSRLRIFASPIRANAAISGVKASRKRSSCASGLFVSVFAIAPSSLSLTYAPLLNQTNLCSDTAPPNQESLSPHASPHPDFAPQPPPHTTSPQRSTPQTHPPPKPAASPSQTLVHPLPSSRGRTRYDRTLPE